MKDYYLPVFASEKPENKTDAEWNLLHRQVCGYIRQWVDDNVLNRVHQQLDSNLIATHIQGMIKAQFTLSVAAIQASIVRNSDTKYHTRRHLKRSLKLL